MNNKLNHLSDNKINELITRYYNGDNVNTLINEYNIDIINSQLYKTFPRKQLDIICEYCNEKMVLVYNSKSNYEKEMYTITCPICSHINKENCRCKNCRNNEEKLRQERIQKLENIKRKSLSEYFIDAPKEENISFKDKIYLFTLIKQSSDENYKTITPFKDNLSNFSPDKKFTIEILKDLYKKNIIKINPDSDLRAFGFNENEDKITDYNIDEVIYDILPNYSDEEKVNLINSVRNISHEDIENNKHIIKEIYEELAFYECLEHYKYMLESRGYHCDNVGKKTRDTMNILIENFSIGQIFFLTWRTSIDVNDYINTRSIPYNIAKNSFIGDLDRRANKYMINNWEINPSRRDFNCPQSTLSQIFFEYILKQPDYLSKKFEDMVDMSKTEDLTDNNENSIK